MVSSILARRLMRRGDRPRLALVTPWPPEAGAVARYSARLVPALARHADVDVVADGRACRDETLLAPGAQLIALESPRSWGHAANGYDRVLYSIGSEDANDWVLEAMRERPGAVLAHDADAITDEVRARAELVLVHTRAAAQTLGIAGAIVPYATPAVLAEQRNPWPDQPLIVCFDHLGRGAATEALAQAFALVAARDGAARLILAGDGPDEEIERWRAWVREQGLVGRIEIPGVMSAEQQGRLLLQASMSVHLRPLRDGEASEAVAVNLAIGVPMVVVDVGWLAELPHEAVTRVPPAAAPALVADRIERLLTDDAFAHQTSVAARRHAQQTSRTAVARSLMNALCVREQPPEPEPLRPERVTVVITTSQRVDRLLLTLAALERQSTDAFTVVVADDRSVDGTRVEVARQAARDPWRGRLRWVGVEGPRGPGRARSTGASVAAPGSTLLLSIDADVLVPPDSLQLLVDLHVRHPTAAVFGAVHWLEPMDLVDVAQELDRGFDWLANRVPRDSPTRIDGTIVGPDPRGPKPFEPAATASPRELDPALALGAMFGVPRASLDRIGGFETELTGYGYEDMEVGIRLRHAGVRALLVGDFVGYHVWHPKHDWRRMSLEGERNLDYLLRRYRPDATSDEWADWSIWWHYHADRGGRVVRRHSRLWAIDRGSRVKLALPDDRWIARLGHDAGAARDALPGELDLLRDAGVARELELDRADASLRAG